MKLKAAHWYLIVLLCNSIIAIIAFGKVLASGGRLVFSNVNDGLKNYFTLYSYVRSPIGKDGILKFDAFNYPFGDYVYFTDNTPLFAIPFRWFCQHIKNISEHTFTIYNTVVVLNIVLCGLLVLYILRRLLKDDVVAAMMAIIIPWINIQVPRIWRGHYNLSFSSLLLIAVCLVIAWHKHRDRFKKQLWAGAGMVLLIFCSFLVHGYYLAITGIFSAAMLFFAGLFEKDRKIKLRAFAYAVAVPLISVGLALGLARLTDPYLPLRSTAARGYDWMEQKTRIGALFTPYYFHKFYFPIQSMYNGNGESAGYLGNVTLYGIAFIAIACMAGSRARMITKDAFRMFFKDTLKASVFFASVLMLAVAMGEQYHFGRNQQTTFYNVFNPFLYLHVFTKYVEQFRSLGRFAWPVFYGATILVLFVLLQWSKVYGRRFRIALLAAIALLGGLEVRDFVTEMRVAGAVPNPLHPAYNKDLAQLHTVYGMYQAILPLPYYTVGSEVFEYTIDDVESWSSFTYRLSIYSGLPLMACKMSRTPAAFSKDILAMAAGDEISSALGHKLNDKPLLVAVDRPMMQNDSIVPLYEPARSRFFEMRTLVQRNNLKPVDSVGQVYFYAWYPKAAAIL